ncbi:MAG: nitroreductase family deazaflavin-dependent oxidoreductase [Pseudomonadales bacterium]|nr:nitroreductase family deazaflavin-dependent oxidoreductase [Pseudomonadales bacterium]
MKIFKIVSILVLVYVGIVVAFESLLGYFQPQDQSTLVIITTSDQGIKTERVLARLQVADKLYVAANHWPRAWYRQVLASPDVQITNDGSTAEYTAQAVSDEEHLKVNQVHSLGIAFRILTGFPPRYFIRLDPR